MPQYKHSVSLTEDKCNGCTNCLKRCPTEAIRIRNGHAVIKTERCIDCGECIRRCPYNAKKATYDPLESIQEYCWKIALPAPALFGQFDHLNDLDYVLNGLIEFGFDDVFEVARGAELVSEYTRLYLRNKASGDLVISSACPAVTRLISVRFPSLCKNLLPILPPVELAARVARKEAKRKNPELRDEDIGVFFISPCPAKVSYVKNPIGVQKSAVDKVLSISDIYFKLISIMSKIKNPWPLSSTGLIGIGWAGTGGEASALFNDKYLAADGIENVIQVLDAIENGNISGLEFVELNACNGGCVGGTMNVENPYISKARLQNLKRFLPVSMNHVPLNIGGEQNKEIPKETMWETGVEYSPVLQLDDDTIQAMRKMGEIQKLTKSFPNLDCGSCGAPSCRALAEDIVRGEADEDSCMMKWKEKMQSLREGKNSNDG